MLHCLILGGGGRCWVLCILLIVHDKVVLPKPLLFFRGSGLETVLSTGNSQCVEGLSWGKDSTTEGLSLCLVVQGSYYLEGMWTTRGHHPVAVVKHTVIPGNKLDKVVTEGIFQPQSQRWKSRFHCKSCRRQAGCQCSPGYPLGGLLMSASPPS